MLAGSLALALVTGVPALAASDEPGSDPALAIVDAGANQATSSLFDTLLELRGADAGILFGQQYPTQQGITFDSADGTSSDVFAGIAEYPAVFGWDSLILEGREAPGTGTLATSGEQNARAWAAAMVEAHELGALNTISFHPSNFVTGGNYDDTRGRVVSRILPGGPEHEKFLAYLDLIALALNEADDAGDGVPVIVRPWHENTGSWFWWGAGHATTGEFKELFRFTVEYLRDVQDVDNALYSFSPNGAFAGDAARYLETYPGDEWVDVLGYDLYEGTDEDPTSDAFINRLVTDLEMLAGLGEQKGKPTALTEFGRNGSRTIKESGNKSLTFYTDLIAGIAASEEARKITYMQTWANWGLDQFYVPYPAHGDRAEHEMFQDFVEFAGHPLTLFTEGVPADALTRDVDVAPAPTTVRLAAPADGTRVLSTESMLRVRTTGAEPTSVRVSSDVDDATVDLTDADGDGWWTGTWTLTEDVLDNRAATLTATVTYPGDEVRQATSRVTLGAERELPVGVVDDFEGYADDDALRTAFAYNNMADADLSLVTDSRDPDGSALRFAYDFTARDYGGFGKTFEAQDWSAFNEMALWLEPDGSDQLLVLQIQAGGRTFEAYPSLAGTTATQVSIPFVDFRPPSWDTANADVRLTKAMLREVTQAWVYLNRVGEPRAGAIVLDDYMAVAGDGPDVPDGEPAPVVPQVVDDFESYGTDAELRSTWNRRDDAAQLSLLPGGGSAGSQAAVWDYAFSTRDYAGVGRAMTGDWRELDRLALRVTPDGSNPRLTAQFNAGGVVYEAATTLDGAEPGVVEVLFADAAPATYQGLPADRRASATELASVSEVAFFLGGALGSSGRLVIDDVRAQLGATPTDPVDPDPTDPTDPVDPDPTDPTDPVDPDPVDPDPTDPTDPTDPVDPDPSDPTDPTTPQTPPATGSGPGTGSGPPGPGGPGSLSDTGADLRPALLALVLMGAGVILVAAARRRRASQEVPAEDGLLRLID